MLWCRRSGWKSGSLAAYVLPATTQVFPEAAARPTTVTSKGQVTIPKPVRDRLGIVPGSAVAFELAPDGRLVLVKVGMSSPVSRFARFRGMAGAGMSTDEIMALTRGDA
jgi:AbrB family looped-hinge helix DNA binding protein